MKKFLIYIIYILILILSIIYISLTYFFQKEKSYLVLDTNNIWELSDSKVKKINNSKLKRLNYSSIKVYDSDTYIEGYIDTKTNRLYNNNYELITKTPQMYILVGNKEFKNYAETIKFELSDNEYNLVKDVLRENKLQFDLENTYVKKSILDNDIYLYSVYTRAQSEYNYSIIFTYKNGRADILYLKNFDQKTDEGRKSILYGIIDINDDSKKEIILLSDLLGSAGNECYSLYKYNEKIEKYESIINCEEE